MVLILLGFFVFHAFCRERKKHKIRWIEVGRIWEELGEEKIYDQNILYQKFVFLKKEWKV